MLVFVSPSTSMATELAGATQARACTPFDVLDCQTLKDANPRSNHSFFDEGSRENVKGHVFNPAAELTHDPKTMLPYSVKPELSTPESRPSEAGLLAAQKHTQTIAGQLKKAAIDLIVGDLERSAWTSEQKSMVDRLNNLTVTPLAANDPQCATEKSGMPTMGYAPIRHTIVICPRAALLYEGELIRALAHEFGHVVSPCTMERPFLKVSAALAHPKRSARAILTCQAQQRRLNGKRQRSVFTTTTARVKSGYFVSGVYLVPTETDLTDREIKLLKTCKLLSESRGSVVRSPRVFASTLACLNKRYEKDWQETLEQKARLDSDSEEPKAIASLVKQLKKRRPLQCHLKSGEHFGDSFAAKLYGRIIAERQLTASVVRASFADSIGYACLEQEFGQPINSPQIYPSSLERSRIGLNDPAVLNALDCSALSADQSAGKGEDLCPIQDPAREPSARNVNADSTTKSPAPKAQRAGPMTKD